MALAFARASAPYGVSAANSCKLIRETKGQSYQGQCRCVITGGRKHRLSGDEQIADAVHPRQSSSATPSSDPRASRCSHVMPIPRRREDVVAAIFRQHAGRR